MRYSCLLALFLITACDGAPTRTETLLDGQTMGTTWLVRAINLPEAVSPDDLRSRIEARLAAINAAMSTWDPGSEISRFNRSATTEWVEISPDFHRVIAAALSLYGLSDGRFDVTLAPLIELWGFGRGAERAAPPDDGEIAAVLDRIGSDRVALAEAPPRLRKAAGEITVNLSAIAKGYGVDAVAAVVSEAGATDWLVEIGGEVRVEGRNIDGAPWRVAIELPDAAGRAVERVVELTSGAIASSGDYRNYFEVDGKRFSHLLDPATGRPIDHRLAAVSVHADTAMWADGVATALMVLGDQRGQVLAEREGWSALFLVRARDGDGFVAQTVGEMFAQAP